MTLAASLRSRARVVRKLPAGGARVEGATPLANAHGPYFACRVVPDLALEAEDAARGRRYTIPSAQMVAAPVDEDGDAVEIRASDRIEVEGGATWQVAADPRALETGRGRLVGWLVLLRRLREPEREAA